MPFLSTISCRSRLGLHSGSASLHAARTHLNSSTGGARVYEGGRLTESAHAWATYKTVPAAAVQNRPGATGRRFWQAMLPAAHMADLKPSCYHHKVSYLTASPLRSTWQLSTNCLCHSKCPTVQNSCKAMLRPLPGFRNCNSAVSGSTTHLLRFRWPSLHLKVAWPSSCIYNCARKLWRSMGQVSRTCQFW